MSDTVGIKELHAEIKSAFEQFKKINDEREVEIKKGGQALGQTTEKIEKMQERMDAIEVKLNRPMVGAESKKDEVSVEEKAFSRYLRGGENVLTADESKAMIAEDDNLGGYLVPPARSNRIIEYVREMSPVRQLATIESIESDTLEIVAEDSAQDFDSGWVGETATRSETNSGKIALLKIPVHEAYAKPKATQRMIEDSGINLDAWINRKVAVKLAQREGTSFISGTGVTSPQGLLTKSGVTVVNSGSGTALTADGLIDLAYTPNEMYIRNATWLFARSTLRAIRKLKLGTGEYIWQPALAGAAPATICDRPYVICTDMPAVAGSAYPILYGDIRAAYTIVDRLGIRIIRDIYSAKPYVEFYTTMRVGGQVVLTEAIAKQYISA